MKRLSNFILLNHIFNGEIPDLVLILILLLENKYLINYTLIVTMNFSFDKKANALYIRFSSEKTSNSDEIAGGIIIDYGKNQNIVGVEILNFTERKLNLNDLVQMNSEELIPRLAQCS